MVSFGKDGGVDVEQSDTSETPTPAERKPVAGWRPPTRMTEYHNLSIGGHFANAFDNGEWWVDGGHIRKAADLRAAQLAAEDEIFEIADAINELRGRK